MYLLFPGRHHLLTNFQFNYINKLFKKGLYDQFDTDGNKLLIKGKIDAIIFAVTSANHSNTRRNPIPFYQRILAIHDFTSYMNVPSYSFGVNDVGFIKDFAKFTLKTINHESDNSFNLTPENCIILCSQLLWICIKR